MVRAAPIARGRYYSCFFNSKGTSWCFFDTYTSRREQNSHCRFLPTASSHPLPPTLRPVAHHDDTPQGRERAAERLLAAERLGQGLARWCANRKASAFYRIVTGVALVAAESDVRERTRRALREAGEGARRAQKAAVEVRVLLNSSPGIVLYFARRGYVTFDDVHARRSWQFSGLPPTIQDHPFASRAAYFLCAVKQQ